MRGATIWLALIGRNYLISTHAPHARRDRGTKLDRNAANGFLLTRLMRGATKTYFDEAKKRFDFYSRASCEARLYWVQESVVQ